MAGELALAKCTYKKVMIGSGSDEDPLILELGGRQWKEKRRVDVERVLVTNLSWGFLGNFFYRPETDIFERKKSLVDLVKSDRSENPVMWDVRGSFHLSRIFTFN